MTEENHTPSVWSRRGFLKAALLASIGAPALMFSCVGAKRLLVNPCLNPVDAAVNQSPWVVRAWQGLDPAKVWDCHVHLVGIGDSDHGLYAVRKLWSLWHPVLYAQRLFYMNASCVSTESGTVDENYVSRLASLTRNMPAGAKAMLFALDWFHSDDGQEVPELSTFYVPDSYARQMAKEYPDVFEWVASIHPYRPDAIDRLEAAAAQGARAVKWLPPVQNIDPASKRCDAFFAALSRLRLPLICHCGEEKAAQSALLAHLGNPLRLRRALDMGVKVVVSHCASYGEDEDLDQPGTRRASFDLFARLMERPEWKENLFGDISATVLLNRKREILRTLLTREDWHNRLLNGSDYPLPGILPIVYLPRLVRHGLLPQESVADLQTLRQVNALHFDLVLKRSLSWQGKSFPARIFETRAFFEAT
ncbi:MAG: amidohydrolase [Syntrophobacterales bacterium]|jgi:mannonate dehydratase|nr:amidohydrolase [Syntrophobacterales bacterium]